MTSLREALAAKRVREAVYPIAVADDTEARARLAEAQRQKLLAGVGGKDDDDAAVKRAQRAVEEAQAAVDACYYPLRLRGIGRSELEALHAAHPAPPDTDPDVTINIRTFRPALIAACAVDSDLTAEEWAAELESERWTLGDVNALFALARRVTEEAINDGLGKG